MIDRIVYVSTTEDTLYWNILWCFGGMEKINQGHVRKWSHVEPMSLAHALVGYQTKTRLSKTEPANVRTGCTRH